MTNTAKVENRTPNFKLKVLELCPRPNSPYSTIVNSLTLTKIYLF